MKQTAAFGATALVFVIVFGCLYGFFKEKKGYGEKGATFLSLGCGVMVFNFFHFIIDGGGVSTRSGQPIELSDSLFVTGLVFIVFLWVSVYFEKR